MYYLTNLDCRYCSHFRVEKWSISFCVEADNQRRYCQTAMTPINSEFKSFALVVKHDVLESCSISWRFSMNLLSPNWFIFWTATFDCKRARWLDDRDVMSNIPDQVEIPTMRSSRKLRISLLRPVSQWIRELLQNRRHRKSDNMILGIILGKLMLIDDSIGLHEMHLDMVWKRVPSGKRLHNYGNSPCYSWVYQSISTISTGQWLP